RRLRRGARPARARLHRPGRAPPSPGRRPGVNDLGAAVVSALGAGGRTPVVERVEPVAGGCISEAVRVVLGDGRSVFAKSAAGLPDGLLADEAEGLRWLTAGLAGTTDLRVPGVVALTPEVLVLDWVEPGRRGPRTDEALGRGLATVH